MSRLSYQYGTQQIEFEVVYRKRKTLAIEIEAPDRITAIVPIGLDDAGILELVKSKSKWIVSKLFEIREIEHQQSHKQYVNGESFPYLGRNYSLDIHLMPAGSFPEAKLYRGKLVVVTPTRDETVIRKALENWYRDKAREKIEERLAYYLVYFDTAPKRLVIKNQQKRWGSCTKNKELLFNWKCVMCPSPILDYIVVHEMCHLVHMNHSEAYWELLKKVLPDYEKRKEWLRNNGLRYDF